MADHLQKHVQTDRKTVLSPTTALSALISAWLVTRDRVLWNFCAGTMLDSQERLEELNLPQIKNSLDTDVMELNQLRHSARLMAKELATAEMTAERLISLAVDEVLSQHTPRFLLRVAETPSAF